MKTNRPAVFLALVIALGASPSTLSAQEGSAQASLTPAARDRVIDGILNALDRGYVFPDVAREMRKSITGRRASGEYTSVTNPAELATVLTRHLQDSVRTSTFACATEILQVLLHARKARRPPARLAARKSWPGTSAT
jgi:hypothetical protein